MAKPNKYTWFAVDEDGHPYIFADSSKELSAKLGLCPSAVSSNYSRYANGAVKDCKFGRFPNDEEEENECLSMK